MQLEQACWFYLDHYRKENPLLENRPLREFCLWMFQQVPFLVAYLPRFDELFTQFRDYMGQVPVCGAILLNPSMTSCLLIRHFGAKIWGFPKGKINAQETQLDCAIREVKEEVGYDISASVRGADVFSTKLFNGKQVILYIVADVPETFPFRPQSQHEIEEIKWVPLAQLPSSQDEKVGIKTWLVAPFVHFIRKWVGQRLASSYSPVAPDLFGSNAARGPQVPRGGRPQSLAPTEDRKDLDTFGRTGGWDASEMFATNERLFGVRSTVPDDGLVRSVPSSPSYVQTHKPQAPRTPAPHRNQPANGNGKKPRSGSNATGGAGADRRRPGSAKPNGTLPLPSLNKDLQNPVTFGVPNGTRWSPEQMFADNARLFGVVALDRDVDRFPVGRPASPLCIAGNHSATTDARLSAPSKPPVNSLLNFSFDASDILTPFASPPAASAAK